MRSVRTYAEFQGTRPLRARMRAAARNAAVWLLSLTRSAAGGGGAIHFPYYHHIFDDERQGFARQLSWMRNHGEFLSYDNAVDLSASGRVIDGCYFCLSFDDGFKSCVENALPILLDHGASAAFFLPTRYIGTDLKRDHDLLTRFYEDRKTIVEFMSWDDCRKMASAGMILGSHTHNHAHLASLEADAIMEELTASKTAIEENTGQPCRHFCCPWGIPGSAFRVDRDPELARKAGYSSFATGVRGAMRAGASPFLLHRDHLLADWSAYQLRYFFLN